MINFLLSSIRGVSYSRTIIFFAAVMGITSGLLNTLLLVIINTILNNHSAPTATLLQQFAILCLLLPVCRLVSEVLLNYLATWGIFKLRMSLCRNIASTPLRRLEELGSHRLLATLTEDIPIITNALTSVPLLCMHIAVVLSCMIYMIWLSGSLFLGMAGFMALGILTYQLPLKHALYRLRLAREFSDILFKHFRGLIEGIKELKLHQRRNEAFLSQTLQSTAAKVRKQQFAGNLIYSATRSWGQALIFMLLGIFIFATTGLLSIKAQVITGYVIVLLYMMQPLEVIMNLLPVFGRAKIAVLKIEKLGLALTTETRSVDLDSIVSTPSWKSLKFVGVTHTYYSEGDDEQFKLGPVNLSFKPGELVFLLGGNGSGKTTLAKIITGLYTPESGEIRLDDQIINEKLRDQYRQHFSAVFSDFYLFENLIGLDASDLDDKAREYLVQLQLAHKVRIEGGELSTVDLSQGQRKRLALLAAYLEDRPFYVFDEWAADQDPIFKEIFYFDLLPKLKARGKTILVITHDQLYFQIADRLIKLEYGQLENYINISEHSLSID